MISLVSMLLLGQTICPPDNTPLWCGKRARGAMSVGDPVAFAQGTTTGWMHRTDFVVQTPRGPFEFKRTFATRWTPSQLPLSGSPPPGTATPFLKGLSKPFGGAASDDGVNWWHSAMPMIELELASNKHHVRTAEGRWVEFSAAPPDCGAGTPVPLGPHSNREHLVLDCYGPVSARSYRLMDASYEYRFQLSASVASTYPDVRRFLLAEVQIGGNAHATVTYDQPLDRYGSGLANCPGVGVGGVPYIRSIAIPGAGRTADFRYELISGVCPIREIQLRESTSLPSSGSPVASYEYSTNGAGAVELRVARTDFGWQPNIWAWGPSNSETYCGYPIAGTQTEFLAYAGFWPACSVPASTEPSNRFLVDKNLLVTSSSTPSEAFSISDGQNGKDISWTKSAGRNQSGPLSMQQTVVFGSASGWHSSEAADNTFTCADSASCQRSEQFSSDYTNLVGVHIDKHTEAGLSIYTGYAQQAGVFVPVFKQTGGSLSQTSDCAPDAVQCSQQVWAQVGVSNSMRLVQESRRSTVASNDTTTFYRYHPSGLLERKVTHGWTLDVNGNPLERSVATFYRLQPLCNVQPTFPDRIAEVEGPCEIAPGTELSATQCSGDRPVTQYVYWPLGSASADVGRVQTVFRYPSGCGSGDPLTTTYFVYQEGGRPSYSVDANGQWTYSLYDLSGRLTYRSTFGQGAGAEYFSYENGRLIEATSRSGQVTTWCYRNSSLRPSTPPYNGVRCDGPWTGRLEWAATTSGNAHYATQTYYEAYENTYGPALNLRSRKYFTAYDGLRSTQTFDTDARDNLTFVALGSASQIATVTRFGEAGQPVALGKPFNRPATLCGSGASPDQNCDLLGYDNLDRLASAQFPLTATTSNTTTIAYDSNDNPCGFGFDAAPSCDLATFDGKDHDRASYKFDDFGNVVRASLPSSGSFATRTPIKYGFDATGARRLVITPAMAAAGEYVLHLVDQLTRPYLTYHYSPAGSTWTSFKTYDQPLVTPASCGSFTLQNTRGRVASDEDPSGTTYYSYDPLGRVVQEARLWYNRGNRCSVTQFSYRPDGQLLSVRYPSGLEVRYNYDAQTHRVSSVHTVQNGLLESTFWGIAWEPTGRLRSYFSRGLWVDNWLGATQAQFIGNQWVPPSGSGVCPDLTQTPNDETGLAHKLVVRNPYSGARLLTEEYTWAADQLLKTVRCYGDNNGASPPLETTYGYDSAIRLTSATSANAGISTASERWAWYGTGTTRVFDQAGWPGGTAAWYGTHAPGHRDPQFVGGNPFRPLSGAPPWQTGNYSRWPVSKAYLADPDGRMVLERWSQNPGQPGGAAANYVRIDGYSKFAPGDVNSMATQLSVTAGGSTVVWQYAYDSSNRRRVKSSPLGQRSFFMYNAAGQLLEEVREATTAGAPETVEEYIYLGGAAVAVTRVLYTPSTSMRLTSGSPCGQMQHDPGNVSCGTRFIATDPVVGKPVAIADDQGRLVWTGEYQPMGARNRRDHFGGIWSWVQATPQSGELWSGYNYSDTDWYVADMVPTQLRAGLNMRLRVRFSTLDLEPGRDYARVRRGDNVELWTGTGYDKGPVRTPWLEMTTDVFGVKVEKLPGASSSTGHWFGGAFLEGYEWTRYSPGAEAYGTPLGFPGQYYDEESEKFENWNRTYDPSTGNYLSPEPLLQNPNWVRRELKSGHQVPSYAYARNNPIAYTDVTGLYVSGKPYPETPAEAAATAAVLAYPPAAAAAVGFGVGFGVGAAVGYWGPWDPWSWARGPAPDAPAVPAPTPTPTPTPEPSPSPGPTCAPPRWPGNLEPRCTRFYWERMFDEATTNDWLVLCDIAKTCYPTRPRWFDVNKCGDW